MSEEITAVEAWFAERSPQGSESISELRPELMNLLSPQRGVGASP